MRYSVGRGIAYRISLCILVNRSEIRVRTVYERKLGLGCDAVVNTR